MLVDWRRSLPSLAGTLSRAPHMWAVPKCSDPVKLVKIRVLVRGRFGEEGAESGSQAFPHSVPWGQKLISIDTLSQASGAARSLFVVGAGGGLLMVE